MQGIPFRAWQEARVVPLHFMPHPRRYLVRLSCRCNQKSVFLGGRFRDATIKEECKGVYPHALQELWKALDRAEDLTQN
jgi:hypothetical protein